MDHSVDLGELQRVVEKYAEQYNLLVAAGPLTAASVLRTITGKNRVVNAAVGTSAIWFAVQELSSPAVRLMAEQFGYLQSVLSLFPRVIEGMTRFIRVQNKLVHVDAIAYVDFLESGRAMIFVRGLTPEKQNIPLDPDEARKLRALLESVAEG